MPNCPECRGTGVIALFTSVAPCGCLRVPEHPDVEFDFDYGVIAIHASELVVRNGLAYYLPTADPSSA